MSLAVAKKKPKNVSEVTIQVRCQRDWLARVEEHARREGLTRSAYIRHRLIQAMNEDDAKGGETPKGE